MRAVSMDVGNCSARPEGSSQFPVLVLSQKPAKRGQVADVTILAIAEVRDSIADVTILAIAEVSGQIAEGNRSDS